VLFELKPLQSLFSRQTCARLRTGSARRNTRRRRRVVLSVTAYPFLVDRHFVVVRQRRQSTGTRHRVMTLSTVAPVALHRGLSDNNRKELERADGARNANRMPIKLKYSIQSPCSKTINRQSDCLWLDIYIRKEMSGAGS
jgi:hypothetical protein